MGWSRGGLTSKIHALVDTNGLPVHLALTHGKAHDNRLCSVLLSALLPPTMLLAYRGYDADLDQGACTPSDVIAKLNAAIMDALADPVVHQRLANLGQEVFPREQQTPQALGALNQTEIKKWWPLIKAANMKAQ